MHERSLRLTHEDYVANFIAILVKANEKSIHQNFLALFTIEVYIYLNGLSPQIVVNDIFKLRKNTYNLKIFYLFEVQNLRTK